MTYNTRAVVLLGLLDLDDSTLNAPTGAPDLVETRGHWRVEHHQDISVWKCLCGLQGRIRKSYEQVRGVPGVA